MELTAFTTSDMAKRRREILANARESGRRALIRDVDGTLFTVELAADAAVSDALVAYAGALAALVGTLDTDPVSASSLGPLAFAAPWPTERRRMLAKDLAEVFALAVSLRDPSLVKSMIRSYEPRTMNPRFDGVAALEGLSEETRSRIERRRQLHPRRSKGR